MQYQGPITTEDSKADERLKVGIQIRKKKLKKLIKDKRRG